MTTAADDAVFLDTNVLVHANVAGSPFHQPALLAIQALYDAGTELWVSRQVLREYLATLSRKQTFTHPLPAATLIARVQFFETRFRVAEDGPEVTGHLLALMERFPFGGKQVHDANIVATMQAARIRRLLTHNVDDFQRFAGLIAIISVGTPESE